MKDDLPCTVSTHTIHQLSVVRFVHSCYRISSLPCTVSTHTIHQLSVMHFVHSSCPSALYHALCSLMLSISSLPCTVFTHAVHQLSTVHCPSAVYFALCPLVLSVSCPPCTVSWWCIQFDSSLIALLTALLIRWNNYPMSHC